MKSINYPEEHKIPCIKIGNTLVPRLILGHLPFVGESYQGVDRNQEYIERFSKVENTIRFLLEAVEKFGVTVVGAMPATESKLARLYLDAINETIKRTGVEIAIIPCIRIPLVVGRTPLDDYRRWLTYYEIERKLATPKILDKYLEDPILVCGRVGWKERLLNTLAHSRPYCKDELRELKIDYGSFKSALLSLKNFKVLFVEPGSETDFLALTHKIDLLGELVDWIREEFGSNVLLASHHAGVTIPTLERAKIKFEGYVTPVNKLGVMMFPNPRMALKEIKRSSKPIIAIKPLAGGRLPPKEAFEYVFRRVKVSACMVGTGREAEITEDFSAALETLQGCP
ncbi:hypothetical protein KEJ26_04740 [Candidatus Bathyarchaeota archaeon]|nr:hypothetical protein [Candidatus Bathyarchaeota archaeon]